MSVTKLPASTPVIKFTQTDLELYLKILTKIEYRTQFSFLSLREYCRLDQDIRGHVSVSL